MLRIRLARYRPGRRRGIILVVVLALLTLFAVVGISFVLVANSQETSARIARDAESIFKPEVDPQAALSMFLGQMLYDLDDTETGARSALRGHSLGRNMYGWWDGSNPNPKLPDPAVFTKADHPLNDKPFNGTGRLYANKDSGFLPTFFTVAEVPDQCKSDSFLMNYQYYSSDIIYPQKEPPLDNPARVGSEKAFFRIPERLGWKEKPADADYLKGGVFTGGVNVPYTYPDHNNFYLAQIDPATGQVLVPSFHREYLLGPLDPTKNDHFMRLGLGQARPEPDFPNPNSAQHQSYVKYEKARRAKYLTPRPMPIYHQRFPDPVDSGGDVKNLDGAGGGCDSIWIDIGAPVMRAPDGTLYKMLVAPLIMELDSRVNLNVVGNWLGHVVQKDTNTSTTKPYKREHRSNQGWGPWEINPSQVLNLEESFPEDVNDPTKEWLGATNRNYSFEWLKLFGGTGPDPKTKPLPDMTSFPYPYPIPVPIFTKPTSQISTARIRGRYDMDDSRGFKVNVLKGDKSTRVWSQVDYNACDDSGSQDNNNPANPLRLSYPNGRGPSSPYWFPVPDPTMPPPDPNKPRFPAFGFPSFSKDCFSNGYTSANSYGEAIDHPVCYAPYMPNPVYASKATKYPNRFIPLQSMVQMLRWGGTNADRIPSELIQLLTGNLTDAAKGGQARRNLVTLLSADLDRPGVTPFIADPTKAGDKLTWKEEAIDNTNTSSQKRPTIYDNAAIAFPTLDRDAAAYKTPSGSEFDHETYRSTLASMLRLDLKRNLPDYDYANQTKYEQAVSARQTLAGDIFQVLRKVTGGIDPTAAGVDKTTAEYKAVRYLGQLAVNMVDYIDNDDVSTAYQIPSSDGKSGDWVFGFETPRLVINEVYTSYDNDKGQLENSGTSKKVKQGGFYNINIWAELMNPMPEDKVSKLGGTNGDDGDTMATLQDATGKLIYKLHVVDAEMLDNGMIEATTARQAMEDPSNLTGDPDHNKGTKSRIYKTVAAWGAANTAVTVKPLKDTNRFNDPDAMGKPKKERGFYVIGPEAPNFDDVAKDDPVLPTTFTAPELRWEYDARRFEDMGALNNNAGKYPTPMLVLQRLANPNKPEDANPLVADPTPMDPNNKKVNVNYNPYITVDYIHVTQDEIMKGRRYDLSGEVPNANQTAIGERWSSGRRQPLAAYVSERRKQEPSTAEQGAVVKHTFFRQNSKIDTLLALQQAFDKSDKKDAYSTDSSFRLPFDWLTHLDRIPISAAELVHTSPYRPYDVLQYFVINGKAGFHKAPWVGPRGAAQDTSVSGKDSSGRLYRFLEFVSKTSFNGTVVNHTDSSKVTDTTFVSWGLPNGRVPGLMNINMVMDLFKDKDTGLAADTEKGVSLLFRALADPQNGNVFWDSTTPNKTVDDLFLKLIDARTPEVLEKDSMGNVTKRSRMVGPTDERLKTFNPPRGQTEWPVNKPYWSLAMGYATNAPDTDPLLKGNRGVDQTILQKKNDSNDTKGLLAFDVQNTDGNLNSYQEKELLTKIFSQMTTRSNVFAVWLTVGFFEVNKGTEVNNPPELMDEVGKRENKHIRHRMFAIIDRTHMQVWPTFAASRPDWPLVTVQSTDPSDNKLKKGIFRPSGVLDGAPFVTEFELMQPKDREDIRAQDDEPPTHNLGYQVNNTVGHPYSQRQWQLQDGAVLVFEPNTTNEETVVVKKKTNGKFEATFLKTHISSTTISEPPIAVVSRGNPGPWPRYDPRKDADVVPLFMLID